MNIVGGSIVWILQGVRELSSRLLLAFILRGPRTKHTHLLFLLLIRCLLLGSSSVACFGHSN